MHYVAVLRRELLLMQLRRSEAHHRGEGPALEQDSFLET
jgi:hypothetical protein